MLFFVIDVFASEHGTVVDDTGKEKCGHRDWEASGLVIDQLLWLMAPGNPTPPERGARVSRLRAASAS